MRNYRRLEGEEDVRVSAYRTDDREPEGMEDVGEAVGPTTIPGVQGKTGISASDVQGYQELGSSIGGMFSGGEAAAGGEAAGGMSGGDMSGMASAAGGASGGGGGVMPDLYGDIASLDDYKDKRDYELLMSQEDATEMAATSKEIRDSAHGGVGQDLLDKYIYKGM